jgi:hypothetical protein
LYDPDLIAIPNQGIARRREELSDQRESGARKRYQDVPFG